MKTNQTAETETEMETETLTIEVPRGTGLIIETLAKSFGTSQTAVMGDAISCLKGSVGEIFEHASGAWEFNKHEQRIVDALKTASWAVEDWPTFRRIVDAFPAVPVT